MGRFIEVLPIGGDVSDPPIGFTYVKNTYIVTTDRVGSGWPPEGVAWFLVPRKKPRKSYYLQFHPREYFEMKRYAEEAQKKRQKWEPSKDPLIAGLKTLNQYLTDVQWPDGAMRIPCTLQVSFSSDQCSVILSDKENQMSIMTTGESLGEVLGLLEDGLANDRITWRPFPWAVKKNPPKRT